MKFSGNIMGKDKLIMEYIVFVCKIIMFGVYETGKNAANCYLER